MASKAGIRHDRSDITVETDRLLPKRTQGNQQNCKEPHGNDYIGCMKWCLLFLTLPLLAQFTERERALGAHLRSELLKDAKAVPMPAAQAYVRGAGGLRFEGIQFELADVRATDPIALPGGFVIVPVAALRNAPNETAFLKALAHAAGHILLKHGIKSEGNANVPTLFMGSWSGVHPDAQRPGTMPASFRRNQVRFEEEAESFAAARVTAQPDSPGFSEARRQLQP